MEDDGAEENVSHIVKLRPRFAPAFRTSTSTGQPYAMKLRTAT